LVKGYSDTRSLGLSKFDKALAAIKLVERRDDAANWACHLREAALKDSANELDGVIQTIKTLVMLTGPAQERIAVRTKGRQDQAT
jgi:indolepyruvate ferredoxin oxidoreductase, beta subunit